MYLASSAHIKQLDRIAVSEFNIPEEILMENAAEAVSQKLKEYYGTDREYAVFCGRGNNAGDGFLTAKNLKLSGAKVKIYMSDSEDKLSETSYKAWEKAKKAIVPMGTINDEVSKNAIVVDALLGISLRNAPQGTIKEGILRINSLENEVVSIDIPSGLSADSGRAEGEVVKADRTFTLALSKIGLNVYPGKSYCGKTELLDIKIPPEAVSMLKFKNYLTDENIIKSILPQRLPYGHKGTFGKVGIAGGSEGMAGSVCMAAEAVLRSGAGMCYVFVPSSIKDIVSVKLTEAIVLDESELEKYFDKLDALAIGMGYSQNSKAKHIIKTVMQKFNSPVVVDGDGLNILAKNPVLLKNRKCPLVITPHSMEFSRLTGLGLNEVESGRIYLCEKFALENNLTAVLKGAATVISSKSGEVRINPTGNSGMATAGSGDVLSGMIAAFLAQGSEPFDAATLGVYIHGLAGDIEAEEKTEFAIKATDIINSIPKAFKKITD